MPNKILLLMIYSCFFFSAQGQKAALKTNLVQWSALSPNIEPEFAFGSKSTVSIPFTWNPFTINKTTNLKWKQLKIQAEYRFWPDRVFHGHFFGIHAGYALYNVGGIGQRKELFGEFSQSRYQGDAFLLGAGYGYHWQINRRLCIEAEAGIGAACTSYRRYDHEVCGRERGQTDARWVFTPTRLSVSFIFMLSDNCYPCRWSTLNAW